MLVKQQPFLYSPVAWLPVQLTVLLLASSGEVEEGPVMYSRGSSRDEKTQC